MIPLEDAQRFVLEACDPWSPVELKLTEALGCVVGAPVVATRPTPPFASSAMDGYAIRAADTQWAPVTLQVIGSIMAGQVFDGQVGPGQAARIMTGAPLPPGADAVCMIEETEEVVDGRVSVGHTLEIGTFVRHQGQDVAVGSTLAPIGTVLTAAHLGVLAGQGLNSITVHRRPTIGVLSSGDELFDGTGPLPAGRIRDANRLTLGALCRHEGWDIVDLGIVRDEESALIETLHHGGAVCDVIVASGGVSMGDLDLVRVVLEKVGAGTTRWMQVAIRPAKPFAFGVLADSGTPVFGLPGNPVSAMVSFELFVRPALRRLSGHRVLHRPVLTATIQHDLTRRSDGKLYFLRAQLSLVNDGKFAVRTTVGQESHQLHSMAEANSLIMLPNGPGVPSGSQVDVLLLDADRLHADPSPTFHTPEPPQAVT
jgi:molybdopterin molybdotransferase